MDDLIDLNFILETTFSLLKGGEIFFFSPAGSWKDLLSLELTDRPEPLSFLENILQEPTGNLTKSQQQKSNDVEFKFSTNAAQIRALDQYSDLIEAEQSLNFELLTRKCKAEDVIKENIELINKRNLESAVKCMDDAFSTREVVLKSYVASIEKSYDRIITSFRDQLINYRKEFIYSHDSFHLLENAVDLEYNNLRNKKLSVMCQLFVDSKNLCLSLKQVQDKPMAWTITKMNLMIGVYKTPVFRTRMQRDLRIIDTAFDRVCETAFKIFKSRSTMQKRDELQMQLDEIKQSIFNWKRSIVSSSEEWVNSLLVIKDNCSIEYLEELHLQLVDLQNMQQNLDLYAKKLNHLSRSSALGLDRFRLYCRYDEDAALRMAHHHLYDYNTMDSSKNSSVTTNYCHPYSLFFQWNRKEDEDEDAGGQESNEVQRQSKERCAMLMGTRIRSLGILADVSLEQVEAILMDLTSYM